MEGFDHYKVAEELWRVLNCDDMNSVDGEDCRFVALIDDDVAEFLNDLTSRDLSAELWRRELLTESNYQEGLAAFITRRNYDGLAGIVEDAAEFGARCRNHFYIVGGDGTCCTIVNGRFMDMLANKCRERYGYGTDGWREGFERLAEESDAIILAL